MIGVLTNSDLQYGAKHPMFLSSQTRLAMLITGQAHKQVLYGRVEDTLTEIIGPNTRE